MKTLLSADFETLKNTLLKVDADLFCEVKKQYDVIVAVLSENPGLSENLKIQLILTIFWGLITPNH